MFTQSLNVNQQMKSFFTFLLLLIAGCSMAQKKTVPSPLAESNKDVLLLALLVNNYLKETDARSVDLPTLLLPDTTGRIKQHFEKIELQSHNGHISAYYTFSSSRSKDVPLNENEKEMLDRMRYIEKKVSGDYDGEIQFDFGERFYRIRRIILSKKQYIHSSPPENTPSPGQFSPN